MVWLEMGNVMFSHQVTPSYGPPWTSILQARNSRPVLPPTPIYGVSGQSGVLASANVIFTKAMLPPGTGPGRRCFSSCPRLIVIFFLR